MNYLKICLFTLLLFVAKTNFCFAQEITDIEYFIDVDPGFGNATAVSFTSSANVEETFIVDMSNLSNGLHTLCLRAKDNDGNWSIVNSETFIRLEGVGGENRITDIEYFFDSDPGLGNALPVSFEENASINITFTPNTENLTDGTHTIYVRARDQNGQWSLLNQEDFCYPSATVANFSTVRFGNVFSFVDESIATDTYLWDFGDGTTSTLSNPTHEFTPGEYEVSQTVTNACSTDDTSINVSIQGIENFEPKLGGNTGFVTFTIYGGGFTEDVLVSLEGQETITPSNILFISAAELKVTLDLRDKPVGDYEVVVSFPNQGTYSFSNFFVIEQGSVNSVTSTIMGSSNFRAGSPTTYTLTVVNDGNIDVQAIPVWLGIEYKEGMEIELDLAQFIPDYYEEERDYTQFEAFIDVEGFFEVDDAENIKILPLVIPVLPSGTTYKLDFKVTSSVDYSLYSTVSKPIFTYDTNNMSSGRSDSSFSTQEIPPPFFLSSGFNNCLNESLTKIPEQTALDIGVTALNIGASVFVPGGACALSPLNYASATYSYANSDAGIIDAVIFNWELFNISASCSVGAVPIAGTLPVLVSRVFREVVKNVVETKTKQVLVDTPDCFNLQNSKPVEILPVQPIASFDPNEKYNNKGQGIQGYIKNQTLSYEIAFENIETASAAAQEVRLIDSLDVTKFDLKSLELNYFTIADSTYNVPANRSEYFIDVDLRPENDLLLRFSAKIDTITGVLTSKFLSIDPQTLNPTEDIFAGFLPANLLPPEGEGNVGFSLKLKEGLPHDTEIRNKAEIYFDFNDPIVTNETLNTLDLILPSSQFGVIEENQEDSIVIINWSGSDVGSGIYSYDVYESINESEFNLIRYRTSLEFLELVPQNGSSYSYSIRAIDRVGNIENKELGPEITLSDNSINDDKSFILYPNPTDNTLFVGFNPNYGFKDEFFTINIFNMNGILVYNNSYTTESGFLNQIEISGFSSGVYLMNILVDNKIINKKIIKY